MTDETKSAIPMTKIRLQVPKGIKVEDLVSRLELSFEETAPTGAEINQNYCCVDVSVVSPVSTVNAM